MFWLILDVIGIILGSLSLYFMNHILALFAIALGIFSCIKKGKLYQVSITLGIIAILMQNIMSNFVVSNYNEEFYSNVSSSMSPSYVKIFKTYPSSNNNVDVISLYAEDIHFVAKVSGDASGKFTLYDPSGRKIATGWSSEGKVYFYVDWGEVCHLSRGNYTVEYNNKTWTFQLKENLKLLDIVYQIGGDEDVGGYIKSFSIKISNEGDIPYQIGKICVIIDNKEECEDYYSFFLPDNTNYFDMYFYNPVFPIKDNEIKNITVMLLDICDGKIKEFFTRKKFLYPKVNIGETFEFSNFKITVTDVIMSDKVIEKYSDNYYKVFTPRKGYKFVLVKYKVKNTKNNIEKFYYDPFIMYNYKTAKELRFYDLKESRGYSSYTVRSIDNESLICEKEWTIYPNEEIIMCSFFEIPEGATPDFFVLEDNFVELK